MKKISNKIKLFVASMYLSPLVMVAQGNPPTQSGTEAGQATFPNPISGVKSIPALIAVILDFVVKIGVVVVVLAIIYSGFLFVKAQGNPGEIDKAKSTFFWTVVGALVLLGAKVLAVVVCNTANGLGAGVDCRW